jgi:membrane associated rhomboid family serine protease
VIIVPISHEDQQARRWPIVTTLILALNLVCFVWTSFLSTDAEDAVDRAGHAFLAYQEAHPSSKVKCRYVEARPAPPPPPRETAESPVMPTEDDPAAEDEGAALCANLEKAVEALPRMAWGDVPARGGFVTLFTYQFLHAGFLHILFNLWFLWLCGTNLEDRWGRVVFPAFYLTAGMVAALVHRYANATSWTPLVGASGAIAGAMGGFLVTYAATRITFFYLFFLSFKPRIGTFGAPAYVMLPLWLLGEVFDGFVSRGDGTAHWAHVGGFIFGALLAGGLKLSGIDHRLDAMNERAISSVQDAELTHAMELTDAGRAREAIVELERLAHARPTDIDVQLELLRAATAAFDAPRRLAAFLRLIDLYIDSGVVDTAANLWNELRMAGLEPSVPRAERLRIGETFARKGRQDVALLCLAATHADGLVDPVALRGAVAHATLLVKAGRLVDARALLEEVKTSPFSTLELDQKVDAQLAGIAAKTSMEMVGG